MRELALFAGAGGGILGGKLLGWRTVCAVEIDAYCRRVLLARQADGCLGRFPIWDDVRSFDGRPWRGHVDVISGGFPCHPFSSASHGRKVATDLWPEMRRIVGQVRPQFVFAENVARKPIDDAADDLEEMGYSASCIKLRSADVGAPCIGTRYWMAAKANGNRESGQPINGEVAVLSCMAESFSWPDPPRELRVAGGIPNRMDRLHAVGNAQVPQVAALAWQILTTQTDAASLPPPLTDAGRSGGQPTQPPQ